ncbi:hypothetical protein AMTRI_Chr02g254770 [Amborella trichopoda]
MTYFNLPSIFVPLIGLVFPAIAMASLDYLLTTQSIILLE